MNNKLYVWRYLFYFFIICGVSAYLIMLTYGYKLNWETWKLEKTSVIYLASIPREANVYLNDRVVSDSTPVKFSEIFPGKYDVRIDNPNYEIWTKTFNVISDFVSQDADIILILKQKIEIPISAQEIVAYNNLLDTPTTIEKDHAGLLIKNINEIYFDDVFVTRFSQTVSELCWFPDNKHIIYQLGNTINFMDSDGSNVQKLVELPGAQKASFTVVDDGKYLIYRYDKQVHKLQITNINNLFTEKYLNKAVKIIK